jgi:hypothetical protein
VLRELQCWRLCRRRQDIDGEAVANSPGADYNLDAPGQIVRDEASIHSVGRGLDVNQAATSTVPLPI